MLDIGYSVHSGVNADLWLQAEVATLLAFFSLHVLYALWLLDHSIW